MTTGNEGFYVVDNVSFDKDPNQFNNQLTNLYTKLAKSVNAKDIGIYANQENLNGQTIFAFTSTGTVDPRKFRNIFRKTFAFTAGSLTFAHGITGIVDATRIFGTVLLATGVWRDLSNNVYIEISGPNIVITLGGGYPAITRGYVTIEYTKE